MTEVEEIFYKVQRIMIANGLEIEDRGIQRVYRDENPTEAFYDPVFHYISLGECMLYKNVLAHELCHSLQPLKKLATAPNYWDSEGNLLTKVHLNCPIEKEARLVESFF